MTIYDRIRTLRIEKGLTQEDAAKALGYNNRSTISRIEKGEVDLPRTKIMAFAELLGVSPIYLMYGRLPDTAQNVKCVPLIGYIACGRPITADENVIDKIVLPHGIQADFALRCKGDSMSPIIHDGDLVFIRQQPVVDNGQIAAVVIADSTDWAEATLKRVYTNGEMVQLVAENRAYDPIVFHSGDAKVTLAGRAVAVLHQL